MGAAIPGRFQGCCFAPGLRNGVGGGVPLMASDIMPYSKFYEACDCDGY